LLCPTVHRAGEKQNQRQQCISNETGHRVPSIETAPYRPVDPWAKEIARHAHTTLMGLLYGTTIVLFFSLALYFLAVRVGCVKLPLPSKISTFASGCGR
jgi:hypothetical protein